MNAYNMKESNNTEPYFQLSMSLADTAEVSKIVEGHWALSFTSAGEKLPLVVDPSLVFGMNSSLRRPLRLLCLYKPRRWGLCGRSASSPWWQPSLSMAWCVNWRCSRSCSRRAVAHGACGSRVRRSTRLTLARRCCWPCKACRPCPANKMQSVCKSRSALQLTHRHAVRLPSWQSASSRLNS